MNFINLIEKTDFHQNDFYKSRFWRKELNSVDLKEVGEFFHIHGGYWTIPNINCIQINTCYKSPKFESLRNVWQLSLFPLGFDRKLNLHFEIRLNRIRGNLSAEKIRIGIAGDDGNFLTCDMFYPPYKFPLFHVIRISLPSLRDTSYEGGLRIFMKVNSKDGLVAKLFNQSKVKFGKDICNHESKLAIEVSVLAKDDIGNEMCNENVIAEHLDKSSKSENEIGQEALHLSLMKSPIKRCRGDIILYEDKATTKSLTLEDNMHETTIKNMRGLERLNISVGTFLVFLDFRATGNREKIPENAVELYEVAHKFREITLIQLCKYYILENISAEIYCDVLNLSLSYNDVEIKTLCDSFFVDNALDIVLTPKWKIFMKENKTLCDEMHFKRLKDITYYEKYMV